MTSRGSPSVNQQETARRPAREGRASEPVLSLTVFCRRPCCCGGSRFWQNTHNTGAIWERTISRTTYERGGVNSRMG